MPTRRSRSGRPETLDELRQWCVQFIKSLGRGGLQATVFAPMEAFQIAREAFQLACSFGAPSEVVDAFDVPSPSFTNHIPASYAEKQANDRKLVANVVRGLGELVAWCNQQTGQAVKPGSGADEAPVGNTVTEPGEEEAARQAAEEHLANVKDTKLVPVRDNKTQTIGYFEPQKLKPMGKERGSGFTASGFAVYQLRDGRYVCYYWPEKDSDLEEHASIIRPERAAQLLQIWGCEVPENLQQAAGWINLTPEPQPSEQTQTPPAPAPSEQQPAATGMESTTPLPEQSDPIARAIAFMLQCQRKGKTPTMKELEAVSGVDRSTLYRDPLFREARKATKANRQGSPPPKGHKTAEGNMEAYDEDEETDPDEDE